MSENNASRGLPFNIALVLVLVATVVMVGYRPAQADAPSNDTWEFATEIALPYDDWQDTTEATIGSDDPKPSCHGWSIPTNTVWYKYTPTETVTLQASTSDSYYPSVLAVFTHQESSFTQISCALYGQKRFTAEAGTNYYFMIGGSTGGPYPSPAPGGNIHLVVQEIPLPPNDNFADATIIESLPFSDSQEITAATLEPGEKRSSCSWWGSPTSIWYVYTPAASGLLKGEINTPYYHYWAVWTGSDLSNLNEVRCNSDSYSESFSVPIQAGTTYYLQTGPSVTGYTGQHSIALDFTLPPSNDDFENAQPVDALPFSFNGDNSAATSQNGEPAASCANYGSQHTVWFSYTPTESHYVTAQMLNESYYAYVAVYTGDTLATLVEEHCTDSYQYIPLSLNAEAGETYYFQFGSMDNWNYGTYTFALFYPPPPIAGLWFWPNYDASMYDVVTFYDQSDDLVYIGFSDYWWDFGDGTTATGSEVTHQYAADGDYTVWHKVQTYDGRTAETTQVIQVRTHDVAITKFIVPQSARLGQTRSIVVGLSNTHYPEVVVVELYKSVPDGYAFVGHLEQTVPVRPANRTTEFSFNYTFTAEDAAQGKVTFRAIAYYLQGYRDALPGDNEVNAPPTRVAR